MRSASGYTPHCGPPHTILVALTYVRVFRFLYAHRDKTTFSTLDLKSHAQLD